LNASAVDVLNGFKEEPALQDLHQFISNSGLFNLDQLKGDLLAQYAEKLNIDKFLTQGAGRIAQNQDLGNMIETLYKV
jgi:hypothetical protein